MTLPTAAEAPLAVSAAETTGSTSERSRLPVGAWLAIAWLGVVVFVAVFADLLPFHPARLSDVETATP